MYLQFVGILNVREVWREGMYLTYSKRRQVQKILKNLANTVI